MTEIPTAAGVLWGPETWWNYWERRIIKQAEEWMLYTKYLLFISKCQKPDSISYKTRVY